MGKGHDRRRRLPASAPARIPGELSVPARGWSDDHAVEDPDRPGSGDVTFDAAGFFEEAKEADIIELAQTGWAYDYAADAVLEWAKEHFDGPQRLWDYVHSTTRPRPHTGAPVGFECEVDGVRAMRFLARLRPDVHARLVELGIDPETGDAWRVP